MLCSLKHIFIFVKNVFSEIRSDTKRLYLDSEAAGEVYSQVRHTLVLCFVKLCCFVKSLVQKP